MGEIYDLWNKFSQTGRVEDYLSYKMSAQPAVLPQNKPANLTAENKQSAIG